MAKVHQGQNPAIKVGVTMEWIDLLNKVEVKHHCLQRIEYLSTGLCCGHQHPVHR